MSVRFTRTQLNRLIVGNTKHTTQTLLPAGSSDTQLT